MAKEKWASLTQSPLSTPLDTRSRPSDLAPASFRLKLNMAVNVSGRLCRRGGYGPFTLSSGSGTGNYDLHRRGHAREASNLLFESQSTTGVKRLFSGSKSYLSVLDSSSGEWTDIGSGFSSDFHWSAAEIQDKVVFTNNVDDVQFHTLGTGVVAGSGTLQTRGIRKAKVVAQFAGVIILFNVEEGGTRFSSRVAWGNYLEADSWDYSNPAANPADGKVSGFYDLDYGDEILNVKELGGQIYIYTRKSIWKMFVNVGTDSIFGFRKFYSEPKNRMGCLAYDNALLSTGTEHYWMGQESIYRIDQYLAAPERTDWLLKASGSMYEGSRRVDVRCCQSPVAEFKAGTKEGFFFYPRLPEDTGETPTCVNDYGLVLNTEWKTADYVDYGMTALSSFSTSSESGAVCKLETIFVGALGTDFCLKDIGNVFHRTNISLLLDDPTTDIADVSYVPVNVGYFSQVIGICPFGYQTSRKKIVKSLALQHETRKDDDPINYGRLRMGNSFALSDPVSTDPKCAVLWRDIKDVNGNDTPLDCVDEGTLAAMAANNQRPSLDTAWDMYEQGRNLYFDLTIVDENGEAPIGSDSAWSAFVWDVYTLQ